MGLTSEDFLQMRQLMEQVLDEKLTPIDGRLEAVENDTKDTLLLLGDVQKDVSFIAKQTGVALP